MKVDIWQLIVDGVVAEFNERIERDMYIAVYHLGRYGTFSKRGCYKQMTDERHLIEHHLRCAAAQRKLKDAIIAKLNKTGTPDLVNWNAYEMVRSAYYDSIKEISGQQVADHWAIGYDAEIASAAQA